ncbi:CrcB family protein [Corynebacterium felinum]|uniref:Fluoride-specific ion channel n=1 Tax=Corynebacterium felinum TaxID=131318 RepID=A0ABU2B513_9CORY|nr:CrcB family protein [Corynebacterium felinum]MDF5820334.1 CrcB family protein [Corynebacterium felinum]MDR7353701.1 CrcB protein [Corynebacterium felinum]WJY95880.1 Putative fluoride ion transporter CrcB [Corynebacterium felinum]
MTLMFAVYVAVAGCAGGMLRYVLSTVLVKPAGTYLANSLACIVAAASAAHPSLLWVGCGFAGALSTWSSVAGELSTLLRQGKAGFAALYLLATLLTGVMAYALVSQL